jgi:hypothetical protein
MDTEKNPRELFHDTFNDIYYFRSRTPFCHPLDFH